MKHIKLEIVADEHQQEELIALLDDCGAVGFEQIAEKLLAFFEEEKFDKDGAITVLNGYAFQLQTVHEKNWNEEWERNFIPVIINDFVAVRAHFHLPVRAVRHEIIITPKMSFGTGHHATTYLMMQEMSGLDFKGKSVFDFGTGTGILSILAEKLGAEKITAIDVDDWSIKNATENLERNSCKKISISLSSNLPRQDFDVVLANINRNVILDHLHRMPDMLSPNGFVLFSGLLATDEAEVKRAAEKYGLVLENKQEREGWISLLFAGQG